MSNPNHAAASKLAQLLGDVITHSTHATAEGVERIRHAAKNEWLDDLEAHTSSIVGPVIDMVLEHGSMPDEIRALVEQGKIPSAAFGSFVQQFLVYGIMFSIASTALGPLTQELQNTLFSAFPDVPLSAANVATALTQAVDFGDPQGVDIPDWAIAEAKANGINEDRFKTLVGIDGQAPDATNLFEMRRRGIINDEQLQNGFLEGPTKNKWIPFLRQLQYVPATIGDMVRAAVQKQLDYDTAKALAHSLGLEPVGWVDNNPDWFDIMYDISGRPPGPQQLAQMVHRGVIQQNGAGSGETTFEQGIAESDLKTKWTDALFALSTYVPAPREVTTLYRTGAFTEEQAKSALKAHGVTDADAQAFLDSAINPTVAQQKHLSATQVIDLYESRLITQDQCKTQLAAIGYGGTVGDQLVELADARFTMRAAGQLASRIHTLYVAHKLTAAEAKAALSHVGIATDSQTELLKDWDYEAAANVPVLTIGEIASAAYYDVMSTDDAIAEITARGYAPLDAWTIVSNRMHGPVDNKPDATLPSFPDQSA